MFEPFEAFEQSCATAFDFLRERFAFRPPEIERIGRESYVYFHKGPRTVSISWEPGGPPIVELFFPSAGTEYAPTPWAERDGVPYARRFPSRTPTPGPAISRRKQRHAWDEPTAATFDAWLAHAASDLAKTEEAFLSA